MNKGVDLSSVRLTLEQCQSIKAAGYDFVGKYLVPETYTSSGKTKQSTKSLTKQDVDNITAAGMRVLSIYETSAGRPKGGRSNGLTDGKKALTRAKAVGMPENGTIYFCADYDAPASDFDNIEAYLKAAKEQVGNYKVGIYGSYKVIEEMYKRKACDNFWQCVAWSSGNKSEYRDIYQAQWDKTVAGITVDINECMDMNKAGIWPIEEKVEQPVDEKKEEVKMTSTYSLQNGIYTIAIPASDFKIVMVDKAKKSAASKNYVNAGFFTASTVTAPVSLLMCDIGDGYTPTTPVKNESKIKGKKLYHPQASWDKNYYGKKQTVLGAKDGVATVFEGTDASSYDYAIAGVPIMRNGNDVAWKTFCAPQGWGADTVRATWHIFLGIKSAKADTIYVMGMKTTAANMVLAAEAYKKFKALGFYDVVKLDGGGSFHMNVDGKVVATVSENRRINNIIAWSETGSGQVNTNPYTAPTRTLTYGTSGNDVMWLQWQLNYKGYSCGSVDGQFGSKTLTAVKNFQKANKLTVDGKVGPATRTALQK